MPKQLLDVDVTSDEELGSPNIMIDDEYGISGLYNDFALVQRVFATRTGKKEDGENEGKIIQYVKWKPLGYVGTPFQALRLYSHKATLQKIKNLDKETNWKVIENIYKETNKTIDDVITRLVADSELEIKGEKLDSLYAMNDKLKKVDKILAEADSLHEMIKDKRRIIIGDTEPKKRRYKIEEEEE